jgi:putative membrane protein
LWGISITADQQLAGAIMKTGGSLFLWSIVIFIFFKRFAAGYKSEHDYRRPVAPANDDEPLTTADVEREFASTPPPR